MRRASGWVRTEDSSSTSVTARTNVCLWWGETTKHNAAATARREGVLLHQPITFLKQRSSSCVVVVGCDSSASLFVLAQEILQEPTPPNTMTRFPRPQNLNDCFYAAAQHMRQKPVALTHKQTVRNTTIVGAATHTKSLDGNDDLSRLLASCRSILS